MEGVIFWRGPDIGKRSEVIASFLFSSHLQSWGTCKDTCGLEGGGGIRGRSGMVRSGMVWIKDFWRQQAMMPYTRPGERRDWNWMEWNRDTYLH